MEDTFHCVENCLHKHENALYCIWDRTKTGCIQPKGCFEHPETGSVFCFCTCSSCGIRKAFKIPAEKIDELREKGLVNKLKLIYYSDSSEDDSDSSEEDEPRLM